MTHYMIGLYGSQHRIEKWLRFLRELYPSGNGDLGVREFKLIDLVVHDDHEKRFEKHVAAVHTPEHWGRRMGKRRFKVLQRILHATTPYDSFEVPDPHPAERDLAQEYARHLYGYALGRKRGTIMGNRVGDT